MTKFKMQTVATVIRHTIRRDLYGEIDSLLSLSLSHSLSVQK